MFIIAQRGGAMFDVINSVVIWYGRHIHSAAEVLH